MPTALDDLPQDLSFDRTPSLTSSDETAPDSDSSYFLPLNDSLASMHARLSVGPVTVDHKSYPGRALPTLPSRPPSSFTRPPHALLAKVLCHPRIITHILDFLSWDEFHALSYTSQEVQRHLWTAEIKELVLARFVPGYRLAMKTRDLQYWQDKIRVSLRDLELFMLSLSTPLHRYPMHALSVLSTESVTWEQDATTQRLQILTFAHSRFVLLLQSMVHSSPYPPTSDSEDIRLKSGASPAGLRELRFPAPLSYFGPQASENSQAENKQSGSHRRTNSKSSARLRHNRKSEDGAISNTMKKRRSKSRLSVFGGAGNPRVPPPPPLPDPTALRFYSGGWRRAFTLSASDDEEVLKPPSRRFVSANHSSESSIGSTPTYASSRTTSTPPSASPHDMYMATLRTRAPIIRLFFPCAALSEHALTACEEQLLVHGLWEHLSVGDIICNFGYVPTLDDEEDDDNRSRDQEADGGHRRWLIFTGDRLVIYYPNAAPQITNALTLPSPFYYSHILPASANPTYNIALPPFKAELTLTLLTQTIFSPHSQSGHARVKQYVWLATVDAQFHVTMGDGWPGEWTLQGEGTKEGKQSLLDALKGGDDGERTWEIVREKSSTGKLWMRLLSTSPPSHLAENLSSQGHGSRTPR